MEARRRVKVYELLPPGGADWRDRGTGHCTCDYVEVRCFFVFFCLYFCARTYCAVFWEGGLTDTVAVAQDVDVHRGQVRIERRRPDRVARAKAWCVPASARYTRFGSHLTGP